MKMLISFLLLFSSTSFSQTAEGEGVYQTPSLVVSGTNFEEVTDCWARIYESENFAGRSVTLVGYTTWADISGSLWPRWVQRINSVEVGPAARLVLYGNPFFADEDNTITGGVSATSVPLVPPGDSIESLRLLCVPE